MTTGDLCPRTLRLLATELDDDADRLVKTCPSYPGGWVGCPIHRTVAERMRQLATDYRTRAIRIDQAAASRASGGEPA